MKRAIFSVACLCLLSYVIVAQQYFPPHVFSDRDDLNQLTFDWYSTQLKALEEPSLWDLSQKSKQDVYRFMYLRSFHHPISVRIEIQSDGSSTLVVKIADGAGGFAPGKLIENRTEHIPKARTKFFLEEIDELKYWKLPLRDQSQDGTDGSQWVLEGIRRGQYKIVDRWSPESGPIRKLGLDLMIDLADIPLLYKEVY